MDFDDLLVNTVRLLRDHPDVLEYYRAALRAHPRRRVPGHQPGAERDRPAARRRPPQRQRRRRHGPVPARPARWSGPCRRGADRAAGRRRPGHRSRRWRRQPPRASSPTSTAPGRDEPLAWVVDRRRAARLELRATPHHLVPARLVPIAGAHLVLPDVSRRPWVPHRSDDGASDPDARPRADQEHAGRDVAAAQCTVAEASYLESWFAASTGCRPRASTPTVGRWRWTTGGCSVSYDGSIPPPSEGPHGGPAAAPGLPAPSTAERRSAVDDQPHDVRDARRRRTTGCSGHRIGPTSRPAAAASDSVRQGRQRALRDVVEGLHPRARGRQARRGRRWARPQAADGGRRCRLRPHADVAPPSWHGGPRRARRAARSGDGALDELEQGALDVFDLEVTPTHSYVADGVLVHNSVYRFRGADFRNIMQFEDAFPEVTTVVLDQNYRSTQTILDAANAVIANNAARKPKNLWTDAGAGDRIVRYHAEDEGDEATFVASTARQLHDDGDELARARRALPHQRPEPGGRGGDDAPRRALQGRRRHPLLRPARGQGRHGLPPGRRQPGRRGQRQAGAQRPQAGCRRRQHRQARHPGRRRGHRVPRGPAPRRRRRRHRPRRPRHRVLRRPARRARRAAAPPTTARGARRSAPGRPRRVRLPRGAGGRGHRRVGGPPREPRRARGLGPRVHPDRRVPRAGVAGGRHRRSARRPGRRPGRPDDVALGQGAGVPGRVPRRRRGGGLPAHPRPERARRAGGGAPARLRRHHPRPGAPVRHPRLEPQPVRLHAVQPAVALHRGDPRRPGRVTRQRHRADRLRAPEPAAAVGLGRAPAVPPGAAGTTRTRTRAAPRPTASASSTPPSPPAGGPRRSRATPTPSGCASATTSSTLRSARA